MGKKSSNILADLLNGLHILWRSNKCVAIAICIVVLPVTIIIAIIAAVLFVLGALLKAIGCGIAKADRGINSWTKKHPRISRYVHGAIGALLAVLITLQICGKGIELPHWGSSDAGSSDYQTASIDIRKDKTQLSGIDISHYQNDSEEDNWKQNIDDSADFVITRITTQGGYVDVDCDTFQQYARKQNKLVGGYFYACEDEWAKDPVTYAQWCAKVTKGYFGTTFFFLDMESKTPGNNVVDVDWAIKWLDAWYEETGIHAGLYMNESTAEINKWPLDKLTDTPLWCANYTTPPTLDNGWKYVGHQFSCTPVDQSKFFVTAEDWWEYCKIS